MATSAIWTTARSFIGGFESGDFGLVGGGGVRTGIAAGVKPPPIAGQPEDVARRVLAAIDRGKPLVYAPWIWRWVMLVIRHLPRFVMRRIGF